ncbi:phasin family protein [Erythrobacter sp. HL-111]|uniref:phasin family protein n=1 Tax=Erythrobacter sp. HL-111 TaxID=1798193 RepID=UPI0006D97104|nr:phasin family protein [Erythrobacter sp. HL-111]KPP89478.1 MAG: Phasin protein [Erythrobacteraceae bacterium HL-111]SDS47675.1 phasin family protein [Erythrobacter sp. HL-111]
MSDKAAETTTKPTAKSKIDAAAEKAYEEAAAKTTSAKAVAEAVEAGEPKGEARVDRVKQAVAAEPAAQAPAAGKAAAKKTPERKAPAKKITAKKAPAKASPPKAPAAAKAAPAKAKTKTKTASNPVTKLKDTIMATATNTDFTATVKDFATDMQERVKAAYSKTGEIAGEMGEFNKANIDAIVESGKIFFTGAQDLVRDNVETGKTVVETMTEDAKKMASLKSPTELMEFQGELVRRNFDAIVSFGSQRTEAWLKLYNDAFAPISNRVSVAGEKMTKAA